MGYSEALEANGVTVKEMKEFGSYQGTWIAILEDGRFVEGSYGSCSGCDSFQAEFDYADQPTFEEKTGKYFKTYRTWDEEDECSKDEYEKHLEAYNEKLRLFGKEYLDSAETKEEIVSRFTKKCECEHAWEDDKEILEWLQSK